MTADVHAPAARYGIGLDRPAGGAPDAAPDGTAVIEVAAAGKSFAAGTQALAPVDLTILAGEFVSLIGPSWFLGRQLERCWCLKCRLANSSRSRRASSSHRSSQFADLARPASRTRQSTCLRRSWQ